LRGDLAFNEFHPQKRKSVIDVRVFHPSTQTDKLKSEFKTQEELKTKTYNAACEDKSWEFIPFVISTDGALAPKAKDVLSRLSKHLSKKWGTSEGVVSNWMKARIAMATARASSACIRRNRKKPLGCEKELEVDFEDKEGLSRLVGMEGQRGDPRGEDIIGNKES